MDHIQIPAEISLKSIREKKLSWSPGMYRRVIISNPNVRRVRELLRDKRPYDRGTEPGSVWYMRLSPKYLIRTKALQEDSCLIYPKGDAIIPVNPKVFKDPHLTDGDILMSKDSNAGETAMIYGEQWKDYMFSGGLVRLHPACNRHYLFSFLKHSLFKEQLRAMTPRGATIVHARTLWLDCLIPFPNQQDSDRVVSYVAALMESILAIEIEIRRKNTLIDETIEKELVLHRKSSEPFVYHFPNLKELRDLGRLDAAIYSETAKRELFNISEYEYGTADYEELGFEIGRGQNLQVSCIGLSIYSDTPKENFYRLVAPTDISEFRTVRQFRFIGNKRTLELLKKGDVVFGAEGFCKGRVVILVDEVQRTISNIHGIVFHPTDLNWTKGIFLGCFLGYLRNKGLVDIIGAGGSGGSLAIGYFHLVPFPKFPDSKQQEIARLYQNSAHPPNAPKTLENYVAWYKEWVSELGIWQLDKEMKALQRKLHDAQERLIRGLPVPVEL